MKQYRGMYIDNVYFHSKEEIDIFLRKMSIRTYRLWLELFTECKNPKEQFAICESLEHQEKHLHDVEGMSWEEISEIETNFYKSLN